MNCKKCGAPILADVKFCTECGESIEDVEAQGEKILKEAEVKQQQPVIPEPSAQAQTTVSPPLPVLNETKKETKKEKKPRKEITQAELEAPYSTLKFMGTIFLSLIPALNIIFLFRWAYGWGVNLNKRNYARACIFVILLLIILVAALYVIYPEFLSGIASLHQKMLNLLF
ncbi:MAG: zinc-ribbon domain-containing protein [Oscillospiraceae bacterium]